jgi:S1-C subfamily serine protease
MRTIASTFIIALVACAARAEPDPAVLDKAKDTVLAVFGPTGQGGGSGVVISPDGYALTNFHVAKPCGDAMKCGMADGKAYDAVIVGIDPTGDVALIKLLGRDDFPAAELGDSDELRVGDACFAMGNPFLLATDYQPTVTFGLVSGVHRYQPPAGTLLEYTDCIQTDASINPGNSGGPLFDAEGRLIGINGRGSFEKRGRVNVGIAYAISINQIKHFLGHLHSGRIVDHATLGATVAFDSEGRVMISDILEDSDAYRRGLRYGDELISFGNRPIQTPNAFKNVLGIYPKGWRVPLSYRRDAKRVDILVRLEGVHGREELIEKAMGQPRAAPIEPPQPREKPAEKPKGDPKLPTAPPQGETAVGYTAEEKTPEEKPDEGKPEGKKIEGKPIPINPMQMMRRQPPMPDSVKKVFEERRGYSNYYFNKLHRDRVWKAWTARCDLAAAKGVWTLGGETDGGGAYEFKLTDADALLKLPTRDSSWIATETLTASLNPPESGGLLLTLHLVRRLNLEGPEKYGDVYYLGTCPLPGRPGLFDVLVTTYKQVETHFYFDPSDGLMAAVEMYPAEHEDPCEIYFTEYRESEGRMTPGVMDVRYGNDRVATFKLSNVKFEKGADQ